MEDCAWRRLSNKERWKEIEWGSEEIREKKLLGRGSVDKRNEELKGLFKNEKHKLKERCEKLKERTHIL